MVVKYDHRPELESPVLVASWPGIGNIGIIAVDALRGMLEAEEFAEIEPWDFFNPRRAVISKGVLEHLVFPSSKFYFRKTEPRDIVLFLGEEQPGVGGGTYGEGSKAYRMANLVLDVAEELGCTRVYTSGAAVALTHHTMRPRVWAVPNSPRLISEIRGYDNTVLMSGVEGGGGQGNITGLNGLLLGVAKKRGFEAICLMGEIPVYLQGLPLSYPRASRSVLEVLGRSLGIDVPLAQLDESAEEVDRSIDDFYRQIPAEIRTQLDRLKHETYSQPAEPGPITDEEKRRIMADVEGFFRKRGEGI